MSTFMETLIPIYLKLFNWKFRDRHGAPLIGWLMGTQGNCVRFKDYSVFLNPLDKTANELFLIHVNANDWIWESREISLFLEAVRENSPCVVLDMGANYGAYTLSAAKLATKGLVNTVVAVEPNRNTFACLKKSVEFNGFKDFVHLVNAAVSDKHNAVCDFYADPKYSAMSKSKPTESEKQSGSSAQPSYQVPCVRMDDLLSEIGVDKASKFVMKIDVEGSEPLAFAGLTETLKSAHGYQIFFEFHPQALQDLGHDALTLSSTILDLQPDLIAEIDHHEKTVKRVSGMPGFERLVNDCMNPTKMWSDYTNIFISKNMALPEGFRGV
jgi:FkbM family methyltransferase